jgi:hypothetical protein
MSEEKVKQLKLKCKGCKMRKWLEKWSIQSSWPTLYQW